VASAARSLNTDSGSLREHVELLHTPLHSDAWTNNRDVSSTRAHSGGHFCDIEVDSSIVIASNSDDTKDFKRPSSMEEEQAEDSIRQARRIAIIRASWPSKDYLSTNQANGKV